jgi:hypothetical protein
MHDYLPFHVQLGLTTANPLNPAGANKGMMEVQYAATPVELET